MTLTSRLLPLEGLLRVAAVGGEVYAAHADGGLVRLDIGAGATTPVVCAIEDKWGDPPRFVGLAARGDDLLLASIDDAWLARIDAGRLTSVRKVAHKGNASGAAVYAASDAAGAVCAVAAWQTLTRVVAEGKGRSVKAGEDTFWGVAVAPDGSVVANGRDSGRVELRDPQTLAVREVLEGLRATVLALAFSPDGQWLVASDDTTRAHVWSLRTGESRPLEGMAKIVRFVFRPDGRVWAVSLTRHVALFDPAQPSAPLVDHFAEGLDTRYLTDAAALPDGRLVCVVEDRGLLLVELT